MSNIISEAEVKAAQAWLHDVFVWGGLAKTPRRSVPIDKYNYMYGRGAGNFRTNGSDPVVQKKSKEAAETICSFIAHRKVETQRFLALDAAVKYISGAAFLPDLAATKGYVQQTPERLCRYIAWFCEMNNLVFDNKATSDEEIDQVRKTVMGGLIWDNYLMASGSHTPENNPANKKPEEDDFFEDDDDEVLGGTPADTTAPKADATTAQPSQPASNGGRLPNGTKPSNPKHTLYRSNCSGIVDPSKPKEQIGTNGKVFKVVGVGNTPTEITLNVKPQRATTPLQVYYGVGTGWNDCKLYFKNNVDADTFMGKALAAKPSEIKSLQVKAQSADKEGYVEVETEFGRAYIVATKLHEDIKEEITEKPEENKVSNRAIWKAYQEGWYKD